MDVELEKVISRLKIFPFHNQIIRPLDGGGVSLANYSTMIIISKKIMFFCARKAWGGGGENTFTLKDFELWGKS